MAKKTAQSEKKKSSINPWNVFWWLFVVVIISVFIFPYLLQYAIHILAPKQGYNFEHAGQVGDQFGLLNTLFSGIAAAGFFCALKLQNDDIKAQREDAKYEKFITTTYSRISIFIEKMREFHYTPCLSPNKEGNSTFACELLLEDIEHFNNEQIGMDYISNIVDGINRSTNNAVLYSIIMRSIMESNIPNDDKMEMKKYLNSVAGYAFLKVTAYLSTSPHFGRNKNLQYPYSEEILTIPDENRISSFWKKAFPVKNKKTEN